MTAGPAAGDAPPAGAPPGDEVTCPVCLSRLRWAGLPLLRWDDKLPEPAYVRVDVPAAASPEQRVRLERGTVVRCPDPTGSMSAHYLPAAYGRHGRPVVIGFVGATYSGKTHLLSAMVGAIERGDLAALGFASRPLDQAVHHDFLDSQVRPLLEESKVLPGTREQVVSFADALLIGPAGGPERPVALFDVAGAELGREHTSRQGAKNFLEVADGLVFVIDPAQLARGQLGEDTFNTVLDLLRDSGRLSQVSAAIVVSKADLLRFEDPVTRWLRTDVTGPDPEAAVSESADIFAYLDSRGAQAWGRAYRDCRKATLHVTSATGGPARGGAPEGVYPRGVRPQRVLGPLVALLAMTGVLPGERAGQVGI